MFSSKKSSIIGNHRPAASSPASRLVALDELGNDGVEARQGLFATMQVADIDCSFGQFLVAQDQRPTRPDRVCLPQQGPEAAVAGADDGRHSTLAQLIGQAVEGSLGLPAERNQKR